MGPADSAKDSSSEIESSTRFGIEEDSHPSNTSPTSTIDEDSGADGQLESTPPTSPSQGEDDKLSEDILSAAALGKEYVKLLSSYHWHRIA